MSLIEDLWSLLRFDHVFSESVKRSIRESVTSSRCARSEFESCRDESAASVLKFVAMAAILVAGIGGVAIPVAGRGRGLLQTEGKVFAGVKAFAAGVILATGFVHMLKDATEAFKNPCLGVAWSKFPFSGFLAMMAALLTLAVDSVATQYYERKQGKVVIEDEERHIVGMHAHAANHTHTHDHSHSHSHADVESSVRHVVVSQVLELGIVSHSVIIGLSLGVSQSPCTMRPLIVALSFHQFFEGFALGGCITQAQFKTLPATIMACVFALTTPLGVGIGASIASVFNPYSPGALITEGILDSLSAGILVYMALVDLIAADFHSKKMRCNIGLQIISFCLLFLGAGLMSLLAIWA